MPSSPHQDPRVLDAGAPLSDAGAVAILLHGRGASAQNMLSLADEVGVEGVAYLAPQAENRSWYPNSFLAPIADNEPELSAALGVVGDLIDRAREAGFTTEQTALIGFSQGACLASEYVARHPERYGGVAVLSGGLIGPEGTAFDYDGHLDGTPVFLGCSDEDPYIPVERVEETAAVFRSLGANVTKRIYEGMGHWTNDDEVDHIRQRLRALTDASVPSNTDGADTE